MKFNKLYIKSLINMFENSDLSIEYSDLFLINLYTMLLSLNNNNYSLLDILEEEKIIKILLIKLNNLKVKIQLKRKEKEINSLIEEIKDFCDINYKCLTRYISNKDEFNNIIDSKDPFAITEYIDKVTKMEMKNSDLIEERNAIREDVISIILNNNYGVVDNKLFINQNDGEDYVIMIDDFYDIFSYLLNIDNYKEIYKIDNNNISHKEIINKIIELINKQECSRECINKVFIPLIFTYLVPNINYNNVNANDFVIENIKISDLYSMANNKIGNEMSAKWNNVSISNEFLFSKINEMINKGMYYFDNNKFVLEYVDNKISDFKLSIDVDKMILFLKKNIELCN